MKRSVLTVLAVILCLALGWSVWTKARDGGLNAARVTELERRAASAELRAAGLDKDILALRHQLEEKGIHPVVEARPSPSGGDLQHVEAVRELVHAQTALATATQALTQSRNRVSELESSLEKLTADHKRAVDGEVELKDDLERTKRVVSAMEAELRTKTDRVGQLETALRKSNDDVTALRQRGSQAGAALAELAEINRRRENTLISLQRRYREVTDQLRGMAVRMDAQGSMPELSRIQTAVQSAEDDLRQLSSLSSQAQRATEKITGSRAR
jgi:chromosome segregation ATPase